MRLSADDKHDMLQDGQNVNRRVHLRLAPMKFHSFEEYLTALDDLLSLRLPGASRQPPIFTNVRL